MSIIRTSKIKFCSGFWMFLLCRHVLNDLDLLVEQVINEVREFYSLGSSFGSKVDFYLLIEIDRQPEDSVGIVEFSSDTLAEIISSLHGITLSSSR